MKYTPLLKWKARVPADFVVALPVHNAYSARFDIFVVGYPAKGMAIVDYATVEQNWIVARGGGSEWQLDTWSLKHVQVDVDFAVSRLRTRIKSYREDLGREKNVKATADARARKAKG